MTKSKNIRRFTTKNGLNRDNSIDESGNHKTLGSKPAQVRQLPDDVSFGAGAMTRSVGSGGSKRYIGG